jgi:hypothetical protein
MTLPLDGPNTDGIVRPAGEIPVLQVGSTTARFVATGALTDGRYGLYRWEMSDPGRRQPALSPHVLRGVLCPRRFGGSVRRQGMERWTRR